MEKTEQQKRQDEIFQKLEEIYQSKNKEGKPTGRNFVSHLIRSYFPLGKCQRVIDVPEKPMKCALTGQKLFAYGEVWNAMQKEDFFKKFVKSLTYQIDPENKEKVENPMDTVTEGRLLGLTGEKTDTYLSHDAYQALYNWYATKILSGDNHINWIAKDERKKHVIKVVREKLPNAEDQKSIDRAEQILKRPQRATMSLGDMSTLQQLHEKLKSQENAKS